MFVAYFIGFNSDFHGIIDDSLYGYHYLHPWRFLVEKSGRTFRPKVIITQCLGVVTILRVGKKRKVGNKKVREK